jgi:carboxylesterase
MQGFTGTVGGVRYYAEQLAAKGLSVEAPRLSGHGTRWQDANKVRYTDWIRDAEQAYQSLASRCKQVFVTGLSMGGTLILYLAEHHPEIAGVIPVNAPVFVTDKRAPFLAIIKHLIASTPAIASDIMEPGVVEPAYERAPTAGAHEMVKLLGVTRRDLGLIAQPLLVMRSTYDHVVPHECAPFVLEHTASTDKEVVVFERSAHVVTMDYDRDGVVDSAWKFIQRLSHRT